MKFLCVSPNPAMDKRVLVNELKPGQIHRVKSARACAGGKAAHVAMILRTLGETPLWIGFAGGETGEEVVSGLQQLGIRTRACLTQQRTRVNLEIIEDGGRVTEILEPGGTPSPQEVADFQKSCESAFAEGRERLTVIFSGSLPRGLGDGFYASLIGSANSFGCRTFLDTSGEALRLGVAVSPQFVKPNRQEAEALFGQNISDLSVGARAVRQLISLGARSVAISLGDRGLLWCPGQDEPVYHAPAVVMQARSTVGCGDATVAAFAHAATHGLTVEETLRLATACAAANCVADLPGAARLLDIENFRKQANVELLAGAE
jgi:1-phosphofructokinase family hexose kinase